MPNPNHFVAIVGGAVSGSEAANQLTQKGVRVAVFEQNALPYGKIEDGLPKWHVKLRNKEENKINEKLSHPLVSFIPCATLSKEIQLKDLIEEWGFSAIILANGAWRDRPLPLAGIDDYIGKGFCYQNQFIYWYNHHHESGFDGTQYSAPDGAVVIGGGLASLDVAKVIMFKNVQEAFQKRGIETNLFNLDRSISKELENHSLTLKDLGLKGCALYYRRRMMDMPLTPMDTDTPEKLAKAQLVRQKVFRNYQAKYLFDFYPQHVPIDIVVDNGRLVGLIFQETEIVDGRAKAMPGTEKEVRSELFISSIGSLPDPVNGVPMSGSVYNVDQGDSCRLEGFENVFAVGNAVTGRGNILESLKHGKLITQEIIDKMGFNNELIEQQINEISVQLKEPLSQDQIIHIEQKIESLQHSCGYKDYTSWIQDHLPERLEDKIGVGH